MLELTLDVFSGRKNPTWVIPVEPAMRVLRQIAEQRTFQSAEVHAGPLGYRGLNLRVLSSTVRDRLQLPQRLNLSPFGAYGGIRHMSLADELMSVSVRHGASADNADLFALNRLMNGVFADLGASSGGGGGSAVTATSGSASSVGAPSGTTNAPCTFEELPYQPDFWNDPPHIRHNNCYAYASNQRTDTFPQPGRASGRPMTAMTTAEAIAASKSDGAHDVSDCFDDAEKPRLLVALVVWPGQDYHWYRKHSRFWGHKPGETPARNVDASKKVITNPETCDRGPYTEFCGYFLLPKSQRVA